MLFKLLNKGSVMNFKKLLVFSPEITIGNIVQILLTILTIVLGIRYATSEVKDSLSKQTETFNQQLLMLFPQLPVLEWHEGEVHPFDGGSSSIKIVAIDTERKQVEAQFNIKGTSINEVLRTSQIRTISVPEGGTYRFMLKDINIRDGHKIAEFVVTEVKGVTK